MSEVQNDTRIARHHVATYMVGGKKEIITLEYRYKPAHEFELFTKIAGRDYVIHELHYFVALGELLDLLPLSSSIMIQHQIIVINNGTEEIATLEEWLFPYEPRGTGTVVYQLKLFFQDKLIESARHPDFAGAAEDIRKQSGEGIQIKTCYFCRFLIEDNDYGGTDLRHDALYCFRDKPDLLKEAMEVYPTLRKKGKGALYLEATPNMDALHSCSVFEYLPKRQL